MSMHQDVHRSVGVSAARASTGIQGLDDILNGGFPRSRLYLVQGDPGVGKTTMAMQFLLEGVRQGERGLYITLSESDEELRGVAAAHGWTLDGLDLFHLAAAESSLDDQHNYTIFQPSEVELGEATKTLLNEVERVHPTRVVLDSLSEMRLLAQDPLRYRRQILALKQFFAERGCTVLLLDDTSETGDLQLQSLAHGVILLKHDTPDYGTERRRVRVVKLRGVKFRGGEHAFNIVTGGLEVFPRLIASEHPGEFEPETVASGIAELDALVGGGLEMGTSTLVMGPAGAGKSTLANQYVEVMAGRGAKAALFLFDETVNTMYMRTGGMGIDIKGLAAAGQVTVHQVDPAQMAPDEFACLVRASVEHGGARVVVIDSLNGYLNSMPDEKFLVIQLHELLTYLAQQGVLTLLVISQHGFMGSAMVSPLDLSYLSDTVLLLRYFEHAGQIRQAISVVKKRSGSHERSIREFRMTSNGIRVGQPLQEYRGVMTGVPVYQGSSPMMNDRDPVGAETVGRVE